MFSLIKDIKKILVDEKIIDQPSLEKMIAEADEKNVFLADLLIERDIIKEEKLVSIVSDRLKHQPVTLSDLKIHKRILGAVPKTIVAHYQALPIFLLGKTLVVAMVNPADVLTRDHIKVLTGFHVHPVACSHKDIEKGISLFYQEDTSQAFEEIVKDMSDSEEMELIKDASKPAEREHIEKISEDAPTIRLTDAIIKQGVAIKASDIFIEPMQKALRIRYRIDGVIREADRMSKTFHFPIVSRVKIISNLDIAEHRLPQDGRFKILTDRKKEIDFRVSILPTALGEKVVLRVLDKNAEMLDLLKLGFDKKALVSLKDCAQKPHGMILACGPTGSGKTTTLYSLLKFIDSPEKNIITVEDPVEYQMKGINQVNVKPQVNLTFASALRAILRQDPDIIMVGEIRDHETMDVAVKAALTGHLVLSSLHTTTAAGSIVRMVNMGIEPFLICSSVLVVAAQRLLRKLCDNCKQPFAVPDPLAKKIGLDRLGLEEKATFFKAKGCEKCFNLGYKGRVGVIEVMILSAAIKKLLLDRVGEFKIKETARKEGMSTMREDALRKAALGLTSIEEVLRVTSADEEAAS